MKLIQDGAEQHFLSELDKIKNAAAGWLVLHGALSTALDHRAVIEDLGHIKGKLHDHRKNSDDLLAFLKTELSAMSGGLLYQFADGDLAALIKPATPQETATMNALRHALAEKPGGAMLWNSYDLSDKLYSCRKIAEDKIISARRMAAYETMADPARVQSIPARRARRRETLVLIVEDDRFTASFAANILHKDYDLVHAKTGEEAIESYIEHAPDVVFLDIHLPGLDGHEVLHALRGVDDDAYVVMLSVDTVKTNIITANQKGAAGFLKKPFTKERMIQMVEKSPFVKLKTNN